MTRKNIVRALLALVFVGACIAAYLGFKGSEPFEFTQEYVQGKIDERLQQPFVTRRGVEVHQATVEFSGQDVQLTFTAAATKLRQRYVVTGSAVGRMRYDSEHGSFFFVPHEVRLINVEINGRAPGERLLGFVRRHGSERMNARVDAIAADLRAWAEEKITDAAVGVLETTPVYTLPTTVKGRLTRAALGEVRIEDSKLKVSVTYLKAFGELASIVFVWIAVAVLVVAFLALGFASPELFFIVAIFGP